MYERRAAGLVVGFGCLLAIGCQDHGQAGAGSGGAVAVAVAGGPAPAASLDAALPATPPATPIYEVPVTSAVSNRLRRSRSGGSTGMSATRMPGWSTTFLPPSAA
jgi:hypothetical protein